MGKFPDMQDEPKIGWIVKRSKVDTDDGKFRVHVPKRVRESLDWKERLGPGTLLLAWVRTDMPHSVVLTNLGDEELETHIKQLRNFRVGGFV